MTDLEQLYELAKNTIEMEKAGLIRKMTEGEQKKFKSDYPDAVMMLGDFLILKPKSKD